MGLIDRNVVFLLHALDQLFDEFLEFTIHLHLLEPVAHFFVKHLAIEQRLFEGAFQLVESLLARLDLQPCVPRASRNLLC